MLSYGSQEAKVYPSGRETKFFFVPSCMEMHHASPTAWWWEWEVEKPKQFKQTRVTTKTRGRCGVVFGTPVMFGLFAFKLGLPEGGGIDKNYLYLGCDCPAEKQDNVTFQPVFCYIQSLKSNASQVCSEGWVCWNEGSGFWELTQDQGVQQGRLQKETDKQGPFSQM